MSQMPSTAVGTAYTKDFKWFFTWFSNGTLTQQFIDESNVGDIPRQVAYRQWNAGEFTKYIPASHNYLAPNVHLDHNAVQSISGSIE